MKTDVNQVMNSLEFTFSYKYSILNVTRCMQRFYPLTTGDKTFLLDNKK